MNWLLNIVVSLGLPTAAIARPLLTKIDSCNTPNATKTVRIIKQWHLPPKTATKGFKEKYPQERNQTAIYQSLADDIKKKKLQLVVAEGCEGEINADFKTSFNGWDYDGLHAIAQSRGFDRIVCHVPLKIEARFGDQILTLCGDNDKLIQEGNLRLSNLRGWVGFWTRLHEKYSDDRGRLFGEAAADLLKIPKTTPREELLTQIHDRIKSELEAFKKSLADRNDSFVKTLQSKDFQTAAVVVGGLHANDLKAKVQAAGMGCEVLEPPGYAAEDEQLIKDFEKMIAP